MKEAKNKEKRTADLLIRWKKAFEVQKEILAKRNDQVIYSKKKNQNRYCNNARQTKVHLVMNLLCQSSIATCISSQKNSDSLDEKILSIDDDFFTTEEDLILYLSVEIERIKELIGKELKELEISTKIMHTTISKIKRKF